MCEVRSLGDQIHCKYVEFNPFGIKTSHTAKEAEKSFYVDDYLGGADSVEWAISLQGEMHSLFQMGVFQLCKWNCSDPKVLQGIACS